MSNKIMREGMALTGYAGRTACDRFNAKNCLWLIYNLQYLLHRDCNKAQDLKYFSNIKIISRKLLHKVQNHVGIAKLSSLEQQSVHATNLCTHQCSSSKRMLNSTTYLQMIRKLFAKCQKCKHEDLYSAANGLPGFQEAPYR